MDYIKQISFGRKLKRNLETSNRRPHIAFKMTLEGHPWDILIIFSKGCAWEVDSGHPWNVSLGRLEDVRLRCTQEVRSECS